MPYVRFGALLIACGFRILIPSCAHAASMRYEPRLTAVPTTFSGTLSPLVIAVDGVPLVQLPAAATRLEIDGTPVPGDAEDHHPFFAQLTSDRVPLHWVSDRAQDRSVELPSAVLASVEEDGTLVVGIRAATEVAIDRVSLQPSQGVVRYHPPDGESWFSGTHALELRSSSGGAALGRLYNLSFIAHPQLPDTLDMGDRIEMGPGDPAGDQGTALVLGYGLVLGPRWVIALEARGADGFQHAANPNGGDDTWGEDSYSAALKLGWFPWNPGGSWLDFRRFEVGPALTYALVSIEQGHTFPMGNGAFGSSQFKEINRYLRGGFYIRLEPVRYWRFGLSFAATTYFGSSERDAASGGPRAGLCLAFHL